MSFTEKIDVLDMIIAILSEHEKKLDSTVIKMEAIVARLEAVAPREQPDADQQRRFYEPI